MENSNKRWSRLSIVCFLLGIAVWLPNFIFQYGYGFWMLTFIINPFGIVFGVVGRCKFGIISNAMMTFSFFIFMFLGYFISATFGGQPLVNI